MNFSSFQFAIVVLILCVDFGQHNSNVVSANRFFSFNQLAPPSTPSSSSSPLSLSLSSTSPVSQSRFDNIIKIADRINQLAQQRDAIGVSSSSRYNFINKKHNRRKQGGRFLEMNPIRVMAAAAAAAIRSPSPSPSSRLRVELD